MTKRSIFVLLLSLLLFYPTSGRPQDLGIAELEAHINVVVPKGDGPFPLVYIIQGSGGQAGERQGPWTAFFESLGVAVASIDSAAARGQSSLRRPRNVKDYHRDIYVAHKMLRDKYPSIDSQRFGIMGFSRGAHLALAEALEIRSNVGTPDLIFALYPGNRKDIKDCPNKNDPPTQVYIFFGSKDVNDNYSSNCKALAARTDHVHHYPFEGAHHGFDASEDWIRRRLRRVHNLALTAAQLAIERKALNDARAIIRTIVVKAWRKN